MPSETSERPLTEVVDAELFLLVQQGNAEAFSELVARYQRPMLHAAIQRLGRADWAEEALQETWFAAFRYARSYDPRRPLRTWLWTILFNQCHRLTGKQRRKDPCETTRPETPPETPAPPDVAMANERSLLLARYVNRLPRREADALQLRFFGGMTFAEISQTANCSLLTAKNRVRRGLLRLAEMEQLRRLSGHEDQEHCQPTGNVQANNRQSPKLTSLHSDDTGEARI